MSEAIEALIAALQGKTPATICFARCESCMQGRHYRTVTPHPWAGAEDIQHALVTGQPEPSGSCGCHCAPDTGEPR
ncbi:excisionase family protein [Streptomyces sp. NPDC048611]|uniref:excisionase family protein n=1 Tax=Streptomyces sp. NPDC048611 TaxID=3155635 RepID=UPI0034439F2D